MGVTSGPQLLTAALAACPTTSLTGCGQKSPRPSPTSADQRIDPTSTVRPNGQRLDTLDVALVLRAGRVSSGGTLRTRLVVENRTRRAVTDTGCALGAGRYALVPASGPGAELWVQPMVDCGGPRTLGPGYRSDSDGPTIPARTKYGVPLPPGDYLAVLEIAGRTERL